MFKRTKVCSAVMSLLGGSLLIGAAPVSAQDQQLERVEITGSAIKRIDAESSVPVTVIKVDELKKEGVTSVEQILQRISASQSLTSTSQVIGSGTGGASFADLRGIGTDKTLVLLNGRRIANNAIDGASVDLNMIPFAALERVEVLRDGASALYGTDAIGGVINFITKRNYTGGEFSIGAEAPQHAGGKSQNANVSAGFGNLETDRYNFIGVLNVERRDAINSQQRAFGARGYIPEAGVDNTSGTTFPANYSQGQPGVDPDTGEAITVTKNANPTFPGCAPLGNGGSINTGGSSTNCRFDPTPYQDLTTKTETVSLFGKGAVKLTDDHTASVEFFYTRNKVEDTIGPVPQTGLSMPSTSPFYPGMGITPAPTSFEIDPNSPIGVNWRATAAGGRAEENINSNWRLVAGLDGVISGWDYNAALSYNHSEIIQNLTGGYNIDDRISSGITDGILNPFGPQTAAGAAYLESAALRGRLQKGTGDVYTVDAKISRELGDWLGAGRPAALALGGELRKERYSDQINGDVASQAASTGIDSASSVKGSRNVMAAFGELNVPVSKQLEFGFALRYDKYSDFGNTTNPKVSFRFQPTEQILARGSYSTGFRAPSLFELYAPQSLTFTANSYDDPVLCPGGVPTSRADPGRDCNQQFLQQQGGNTGLQPEKSKNFTLGLVFEPTKDFNIGFDFWWIRLQNSIDTFPEAAVFGDPVRYASRFRRAADGTLTPDGDAPGFIFVPNDNLGGTEANGIDVSASYRMKLPENWGLLSVGFSGTYVDTYKFQREKDGPFIDKVSVFVDDGVIFRWKHSLTVALTKDNWSVGVTNRYSSPYTDENVNVEPEFFRSVPSYMLFDLFGSWSPMKALTLTAGIKNVMDRDPPFTNQGQTFQAGYDPRYTDPTGRAYYAGLTYVFK